MLSIQVFSRSKGDHAAAKKEMEEVAAVLEQYLEDDPDFIDQIITEAAYNEIKRNITYLSQFPDKVRLSFVQHSLFSIFNTVRVINGLDASDAMIAAYMITAEDWEAIKKTMAPTQQQIGGSIVSFDDAATLFVNDAPLCSRAIKDNIDALRSHMDELDRRQRLDVNVLTNTVARSVQDSDTMIRKHVADAEKTILALSKMIDTFSYATHLYSNAALDARTLQVARAITKLGNDVYASYLSLDVPARAKYLWQLSLGDSTKVKLPSDLNALMRNLDISLGDGQLTLYGVAGHRWLLYSLNEDALEDASLFFDSQIDDLKRTIRTEPALSDNQRNLLLDHINSTFPVSLVRNVITSRKTDQRSGKKLEDLRRTLVDYFTVETETMAVLNVARDWIRNGRSIMIVGKADRAELDVKMQAAEDYLETVDALSKLANANSTRVFKLFDSKHSFGTVSALVDLLYRTETRQFSEDELSYSSKMFNATLRTENIVSEQILRDYILKRLSVLRQILSTDAATLISPSFSLLRVYTRAQAFLLFISNYVDKIDLMLQREFTVNPHDLSDSSALLKTLLPEDNVTRLAFFGLHAFVVTDEIPFLDAVLYYFATIHFYLRNETSELGKFDGFFGTFLRNLNAQERLVRNDISSIVKYGTPADAWSDGVFTRNDALLTPTERVDIADINIDKKAFALDIYNFSTNSLAEELKVNIMFPVLPLDMQQPNLQETTEKTFSLLDLLLGGVVSVNGDAPFALTCVHIVHQKMLFSVYAACVIVYIYNTEYSARYVANATLNIWMLLEEHFRSVLSDIVVVPTAGVPDPTGAATSGTLEGANTQVTFNAQQYLINFEATPTSIDDVLFSTQFSWTENIKKRIWRTCPQSVKNIVEGWLRSESVQRHCVFDAELPFGFWNEAKRVMFLLGDDAVAASTYSAAAAKAPQTPEIEVYRLSNQDEWTRLQNAQDQLVDAASETHNSIEDFMQSLNVVYRAFMIQDEPTAAVSLFDYHNMVVCDARYNLLSKTLDSYSRHLMVLPNIQNIVLVGETEIASTQGNPVISVAAVQECFSSIFEFQELNSEITQLLGLQGLTFERLLDALFLSLVSEDNQRYLFDDNQPEWTEAKVTSATRNYYLLRQQLAAVPEVLNRTRSIAGKLVALDQEGNRQFTIAVTRVCELLLDVCVPVFDLTNTVFEAMGEINPQDAVGAFTELMELSVRVAKQRTVDIVSFYDTTLTEIFKLFTQDIYVNNLQKQEEMLEKLEAIKDLIANDKDASIQAIADLGLFFQLTCLPSSPNVDGDDSWSKNAIDVIDKVIISIKSAVYVKNETISNFRNAFKRTAGVRTSPIALFRQFNNEDADLVSFTAGMLGDFVFDLNTDIGLQPETLVSIDINDRLELGIENHIYSNFMFFAAPIYLKLNAVLFATKKLSAVVLSPGLLALSTRHFTADQTSSKNALQSFIDEVQKPQQPFEFNWIRDLIIETSRVINSDTRYGSAQLLWISLLDEVEKRTNTEQTVVKNEAEWRNHLIASERVEENRLDVFEQIVVRTMAQTFIEVWTSMFEPRSSTEQHFQVFVENNSLLIKHGIHRSLAVSIFNAK